MKHQLFKVEGLTRYSAGISFVLHLLFLWSVGYLFMPRHLPPAPKPVKIKFIVPKPPPPPEIKKEEVKKEEVKKEEIKKMVKVEPKTLPQPVVKKIEEVPAQNPALKPVEPQAISKPAIPRAEVVPVQSPAPITYAPQPVTATARQPLSAMTIARVTVPDNLPTAKSFPVSETAFSPRGENKGAVSAVQSSAHRVDTPALAPRSTQTSFPGAGRGSEKMAMVASQIKKVSLPAETLRTAPEIAETKPSPDPQILKGYLGTIQSKIERAKEYPDIARRAGSQGRVKIQFTILKDGRIENPILLDKTPHRVLNDEAIAAVNRAAPFERLPDEIGKDSLNVILPFSFLLN